jgi:outer membrane protein OmpA-like peptidoglycan-associated protein
MKTNILLAMLAIGGIILPAQKAAAQDTVMVSESLTMVADPSTCSSKYYSTTGDNWFLQLGAGVNVPFVEYKLDKGDPARHFTMAYNLGFGKWMSPYLAWRISMQYGSIHWDYQTYSKAKMANANLDFMWDMFNSLGGVNTSRVFSIVPFVGLGGTFTYDFKASATNIYNDHGSLRHNSWTLPVSAGLQMRLRLCSYADFFIEGRASFYGDNFNLCAYGTPVDIDITALAGFTINFGGSNFKSFNHCDDLAYINSLNGQINAMRADLAATAAALAVAQSQLPCPEVAQVDETQIITAPMLTTVRFTINSDQVSEQEMVNVYNVAQYLNDNPGIDVVICGYADKDTGSAQYNLELSQRRAQAVYNLLTDTYGISPSRLAIDAQGSSTQIYPNNDWNRIVIFVPAF